MKEFIVKNLYNIIIFIILLFIISLIYLVNTQKIEEFQQNIDSDGNTLYIDNENKLTIINTEKTDIKTIADCIEDNYNNQALTSCKFIFKNDNFNIIYSSKKTSKLIEEKIFNSVNCYNLFYCNNLLYSAGDDQTVNFYKYNNDFIKFEIILNNADYLTCLKMLINDDATYTYILNKGDEKKINLSNSINNIEIKLNNIPYDSFDLNINSLTINNIKSISINDKILSFDLNAIIFLYCKLIFDSNNYFCICQNFYK